MNSNPHDDNNNNDDDDPPGRTRGNTLPPSSALTSTPFLPHEHSVTSVTVLSQAGADDETAMQVPPPYPNPNLP